MVSRIGLGLGCILWIGATAFLALTSTDEVPGLRVGAAVYVSLPGFFTLLQTIAQVKPDWRTRYKAKLFLQVSLVEIARSGAYSGDITEVGFHVWVLPSWYRLLPLSIRRRPKPDDRRLPIWLRPRLRRLARYRFERREDSGVTFRKGVGVIGRCIDLNVTSKIHIVRLDSQEYQDALTAGPENWDSQPMDIRQRLSHSQAAILAESYGQVAAVPLRHPSKGDAIGCVTLDLPPGAQRLEDAPRGKSADPLLRVLQTTARNLSNMLTK